MADILKRRLQNNKKPVDNNDASNATAQFSSISELAKHRMNKPVVKPSSITNLATSSGISSLADLMKARMKSSSRISVSTDANTNVESVKSEMEQLKLTEKPKTVSSSSDTSQKSVIDLTSALCNNFKVIPTVKPVEVETFVPRFVDCDIVPSSSYLLQYSQDCEIDASNVLNIVCPNRQRNPTTFGKILCTKYRLLAKPYFRPIIPTFNTHIKQYRFKDPSPDDLILNKLKKK